MELDRRLFNLSDAEDEDEVESSPGIKKYVARDSTIWKECPPVHGKKLKQNIITFTDSGATKITNNLDIGKVFQLLISEEIVYIIFRETNRKGAQQQPDKYVPFTRDEIYAFIGLLLYAGVTRSNRENIAVLWQPQSHPIYRTTMTRNIFSLLLKCIRFDNSATRVESLKSDKSAPISEIFAKPIENMKKCYVAGQNVTVDEQLYAFRGRTRFTQYIPSKPAKYGIKVWWANDSETSYPISGQIYTGLALTGERDINQGERVVKEHCCNLFSGSGRNITCDNFFYNVQSGGHFEEGTQSINFGHGE